MEKETTIYDLAQRLNISVATVSRALKDDPVVSKKTKKKIMDLAEELGYRSNNFARNLRSQKTNTLGVIVPRLDSYFMSTVLAGMEEVAHAEGYHLIISQSFESAEREIASARTMFNNRVDGLLVSLAADTGETGHFDVFFKRSIPVIFFDRVLEHDAGTNILIDNRKAGYEATRHLVEQGCRRIVHITTTPKRNVYIDRLQGYQQALAKFGLTVREEDVLVGNLSQEAGTEAAERILQMDPRPDGVFAANDSAAVGCMVALKKKGFRIPEDIAFVGFNDDPIATVIEPNLTTIRYPGKRMGEMSARALISHLTGQVDMELTNTILLRSELVVRESSLREKRP
ncbi:LacI family DNA-binding transcriptional regulator [Paraflavisolibacter sp. H34]|uniref:LacI family DNA-binding transcriptional regulator n=1 Tax=Huijunlia imazamoxiresistens TaxID=3127457 RepID=UPI0030173B77